MASADWITQKLAAAYLEDGTYYENLAVLRDTYRRKRDAVCGALDRLSPLGVRYRRPRGGEGRFHDRLCHAEHEARGG